MKITITLSTDNAAFAEDGGAEVARILRGLADDVENVACDDFEGQRLRDSNGNTVGYFTPTK